MRAEAADPSTIPLAHTRPERWETSLRALAVGFVSLLVALALFGLLGVQVTTTGASSHGFTLQVRHAVVSRAGLATPFAIEVSRADGTELPAQLTVRVSSDYLAMFDENGLEPLPGASFRDRDWTAWNFEIPPGKRELTVSLDARIEPAVQWGRDARVAIDVDDHEMVAVEVHTWVSP